MNPSPRDGLDHPTGLQTTHARHHHVQQHQVDVAARRLLDRRTSGSHQPNLVALTRQELTEIGARRVVILGDHDPCGPGSLVELLFGQRGHRS